MLFDNDFIYNDDINFQNFEFCDSDLRQKQPFPPIGGNFPPKGGSFPPESYPPTFESDNLPNFNYPGGNFNPPGMPKSPPPNYVPHKNDAGVQKMAYGEAGPGQGVQPYAVSANSIRFCLYKYTYIWETSGRNYWAFLLNVSRRTVSGFRWFRGTWVYFGLDLRRIDSFVCYRSALEDNCDTCENCEYRNTDDISLYDTAKEYSSNGTRDIYSKTLSSIDIPQTREDSITKTIGYVDDTNIESAFPCVKARNISYRITLEVTYPSSYDEGSKNKIMQLTDEASNDALKIISSSRSIDEISYNPLEAYNSSVQLIPEALKAISDSFNGKLNSSDSSIDNFRDITFSIRKEKICSNWKPYFYGDSLL